MTKEIKADTQEIRTDTTAIKADTAQILAEIARLQQQLPQDPSLQNTSGFMLERYLDNLTTYAVCDSFPDDLETASISFNDGEGEAAAESPNQGNQRTMEDETTPEAIATALWGTFKGRPVKEKTPKNQTTIRTSKSTESMSILEEFRRSKFGPPNFHLDEILSESHNKGPSVEPNQTFRLWEPAPIAEEFSTSELGLPSFNTDASTIIDFAAGTGWSAPQMRPPSPLEADLVPPVRPPNPSQAGPTARPYVPDEAFERPRRPPALFVDGVQLFNRNFVLDVPVSKGILDQVLHIEPPGRDEFTHVRYSALTCQPSEFVFKRFLLRTCLFAKPRKTEIFFAISIPPDLKRETMALALTLMSVIRSVHHLMNEDNELSMWDKDPWKRIVVGIISNGLISNNTRVMLQEMGACLDWNADVKMKIRVQDGDGTIYNRFPRTINGQPVRAHLYEVCLSFSIYVSTNSFISTLLN
jgi:hypothetical protein